LPLLASLLLSTALAVSGSAPPAASDCPVGDAKAFEAMMDRTIFGAGEAYAAFEREEQNAIAAEANALVADKIWTEQQRGAFFADALEAPALRDEQRLKDETLLPRYLRALQAITMTASDDDCTRAKEALATFEEITASGKRQYAWMRERLRAARTR
jgi:hypothetical protein